MSVPAKALPVCIQPRLGLQVFGSVPPGCFGYLVEDDDSAPVLRPGEFAIINTNARQPEAGALFLIEYNQGHRHIVETDFRQHSYSRKSIDPTWWAVPYNRPRSREELEAAFRKGGVLRCSDGPYEADGAYLASKLVGKVIGVLAPDRHGREELQRRRDVAHCPPHVLADGYGAKPAGYVEPAGSASYRRGVA